MLDGLKKQWTLWSTRYWVSTPLYMLQPEERLAFRLCSVTRSARPSCSYFPHDLVLRLRANVISKNRSACQRQAPLMHRNAIPIPKNLAHPRADSLVVLMVAMSSYTTFVFLPPFVEHAAASLGLA